MGKGLSTEDTPERSVTSALREERQAVRESQRGCRENILEYTNPERSAAGIVADFPEGTVGCNKTTITKIIHLHRLITELYSPRPKQFFSLLTVVICSLCRSKIHFSLDHSTVAYNKYSGKCKEVRCHNICSHSPSFRRIMQPSFYFQKHLSQTHRQQIALFGVAAY